VTAVSTIVYAGVWGCVAQKEKVHMQWLAALRVCLRVPWSSDLEGWRPLHYADRLECFKQQGAAKEMFVAQSPRSPPSNHRKPQVHCPCNVAYTFVHEHGMNQNSNFFEAPGGRKSTCRES